MAVDETLQIPNKSGSVTSTNDLKALLVAAVVLTLPAVVAGWFIGHHIASHNNMNAPIIVSQEGNQAADLLLANSRVTILAPLISDLLPSEGGRVRIEIALVSRGQQPLEPELIADISNDFVALLRQSAASQIKGATGFMYLREDLLERAIIRSHGQISNILIPTFVIEQE